MQGERRDMFSRVSFSMQNAVVSWKRVVYDEITNAIITGAATVT